MECAECKKQASYSVEIDDYTNGHWGMRTTEWKHLCKKCYKEWKENK